MSRQFLFVFFAVAIAALLALTSIYIVSVFWAQIKAANEIAGGLQALAQVFLTVGVIGGGIWALWLYLDARRSESVSLVRSLFQDFYLSRQFDRIRSVIEYDYESTFEPILVKRVSNRSVTLNEDERNILRDFDGLLNYFESLLLLERQGRMSKSDRIALFDYWFELFAHDETAALRRYVLLGFELVARELGVQKTDFIFLETKDAVKVPGLLSSKARPGFAIGTFADVTGAFQRNPDEPFGERNLVARGALIPISANSESAAIAAVDKMKEYLPDDEASSRLLRRRVRVYDSAASASARDHNKGYDAWIYAPPKTVISKRSDSKILSAVRR